MSLPKLGAKIPTAGKSSQVQFLTYTGCGVLPDSDKRRVSLGLSRGVRGRNAESMSSAALPVSAGRKIGMAGFLGASPKLAEIPWGPLLESLKDCAVGVNTLGDANPGVRVLRGRVAVHDAW